jgi:hypothetical protein
MSVIVHRAILFVVVSGLPLFPVVAQQHAQFSLILETNYLSAEKTLELYAGLSGRPEEIAELRGSQLALAVTGSLARRHLDTETLKQSLEAAKFNQTDGDDIFRMRSGRAQAAAIKELLVELRRRNFGQRVVSTVEQLFPADARVNARIPMYVVAFGHQNIDAYVVRVQWQGNTPIPTGETEGELTIVVNVAKAVSYGESTDERFLGLLSVVAHEVFHAAFGVYKETAPEWRTYYATPRRPFDELLDLSQNEGIAYYLSLIQQTGGRLPPDGLSRAQSAFDRFNAAAAELLTLPESQERTAELLRQSNTSGYWESFGSMAGMIAARQIDQTLGRSALVETLRSGPNAFFATYAQLMKRDRGIPSLSPLVLEEIARRTR